MSVDSPYRILNVTNDASVDSPYLEIPSVTMGKEPKSRTHACPQCDYKTGNVSHLKAHVWTVHEQRRDHACSQCDAAFGQAAHLSRHVRTVHEQRRDHACPTAPDATTHF